MLEIRFHGRGGQGAVTAAELLAQAAIGEDRYAQGFPNFGAERRGAPVSAYLRMADSPICLREKIDRPDVVVILDPTLVGGVDVLQGLREDGTVVLNTPTREARGLEPSLRGYRLALVDASRIAIDTLGVPIANTAMIGAMVRATGLVRMESLADPIAHRFGRLAEKNLQAIRRAFEETVILEAAMAGTARAAGAVPTTADGVAELRETRSVSEALHAWPDLPIGCDIAQPGNSAGFHTGNWRTTGRPVTDYARCTKCGICWILCPDVAWVRGASGFYDLDDRYCKGCGICAEQCPRQAIAMQGENP